MPIVLEKARLNLWNVVGFAVGISVTSFGWGVTYMKMDGAIASIRAEAASVKIDAKQTKDDNARSFIAIESKLAPITSLQFQAARALEQVAEQKSANDETNKRIDRVVDSFNSKMDTLIGGVNSLNVKVEVLSSTVSTDRNNNRRNTP